MGQHRVPKVTPIRPVQPDGSIEDQCVAKLIELQNIAQRLREMMDFCVERISDERFLSEAEHQPALIISATLAYAKRHQCSVLDAREYIVRALAERQQSRVDSPQAAEATQPTEEQHHE